MEFEQFEVETDKPVFVQFTNPFTGALLFEKKEEDGSKVDDETKPVGVNLYGQDSKPFIARRRFILDKKAADAQKGKPGALKVNEGELDASNRETVIACIESFVNVTWENADLGGNRKSFDAFFKKHPWAFQFCNLAIMDRANFQKASQKD